MKFDLKKVPKKLGTTLAAAGLGVFFSLSHPLLVQRLQDLVFDLYQRASPRIYDASVPVRIVDIDDASLRELGQWPWPRDQLALVTHKLKQFGAQAIAFDILFAEADRASMDQIAARLANDTQRAALSTAFGGNLPSNDAAFALELAASPSVLGQTLTQRVQDGTPKIKTALASSGDDPLRFALPFSAGINPIEPLAAAAHGLGAINLREESDTIVRRVPLVYALDGKPGRLVPSLHLEALRVEQNAGTILVKSSNASGARAFGAASGIVAIKVGDLIIQPDSSGAVRIHYAGTQAARRISAAALLHDDALAEQVQGRIILIGTSAAGLNDIRATPLSGAVPGVDIHAEALENILSGTSLLRPDDAPAWEALGALLLCLFCGAAGMLLSPFWGAIAALVLLGSAFSASFLAFLHYGLLIDALVPSFAAFLAYSSASLLRYWQVERQKRWVSLAFSRYVAPEIVERLSANPSSIKLGGETRILSILFCDVRGFTSRAQGMDAQAVVAFLNRVHTPLTDIILRSGGTVDKYLGDGLMAFWNAPLDVPDHAQRAVTAAIAMQKAATKINQALEAEAQAAGKTHAPFKLGIGVNSGEAFVGNMGSEQRFDYSIVGDAVNIAARLEALTKERELPIMVAEETAKLCNGFEFTTIGEITLKGRTGGTRAYGLSLANETPV